MLKAGKMSMNKRNIVLKSVGLQNLVLKKYKRKLDIVPDNCTVTQKMECDSISMNRNEEYWKYRDYVRFRTVELLAEEIRNRFSESELRTYSIAEAGVFLGDFSQHINDVFPECNLYLYDTFEGFDEKDLKEEKGGNYTETGYLNRLSESFRNIGGDTNNKIKVVSEKMKHPDMCKFRKGYFPDSAVNEKNLNWVFVSLDMDLYKPIKDGIMYFYPKLVEGGYIMIHDYNSAEFHGVKQALREAQEILGRIYYLPLTDAGGTIVLTK